MATPPSPAEAEASGQQYVTVAFGGAEFLVPLDVDEWPLDVIRRCRGLNAAGSVVINHVQVVAALRELLGAQWPAFLAAAPKRRQLIPASQVFAAAVGIAASQEADLVFGGIPWLLGVIEAWPDKVESDLDQFWHRDYRDRWRFDGDRRRLTLRQIHARLSNLRIDSAVAIALNGGHTHKTNTDLLLMDVCEAVTGRRHPSRPMSEQEIAERDALAAAEAKARADHHDRLAKRADRQKSIGVENARANARRAQQDET